MRSRGSLFIRTQNNCPTVSKITWNTVNLCRNGRIFHHCNNSYVRDNLSIPHYDDKRWAQVLFPLTRSYIVQPTYFRYLSSRNIVGYLLIHKPISCIHIDLISGCVSLCYKNIQCTCSYFSIWYNKWITSQNRCTKTRNSPVSMHKHSLENVSQHVPNFFLILFNLWLKHKIEKLSLFA